MFESQPGLQARPTTSWPSPAEDYYEGPLSLDKSLIRNPAATFLMRVAGDGLRSIGMTDGDVLVVDRSVDPGPGHVVVVVIEGQHRVGLLQPAAVIVEHEAFWGEDEREGPHWASSGHQPWGGAEGWCLGTDDLILPIPSGSTIFGVARFAVHHLPGTPYQPGRAQQLVPPDALGRASREGRGTRVTPPQGEAP